PAIALAAGLHGAQWRVFQPVYASGPHKRMTAVTMQMIGSTLLKYGLAQEEEIDTLVQRLNAFADNASTLAALPRIVQVWGTAYHAGTLAGGGTGVRTSAANHMKRPIFLRACRLRPGDRTISAASVA